MTIQMQDYRKREWKALGPQLIGRLAVQGIMLLVLLVLPAIAFAQLGGLHKGDRVKVTAPSLSRWNIVGTVTSVSDSTLKVQDEEKNWYIPGQYIDKLAISVGKKRNTWKGAAIGAVTGGVLLGLIFYATNEESNNCREGSLGCFDVFEVSDGEAFIVGTVMGGALGGALGIVSGALSKRDRWEERPLKLSLAVLPSRTEKFSVNPGFSLRISLNKAQ